MKTALWILVAIAYLYLMYTVLRKVRKSKRKQVLKYQLFFTAFLLVLLATARMLPDDFFAPSPNDQVEESHDGEEAGEAGDDLAAYQRCPCNWKSLRLKRNDYALEHRPAAERLSGNFFITDDATRATALRTGQLVPLIADGGMRLQRFQHSTPHLLPIAAERVGELSKRFKEKLKGTQEEDARFVISSVTRTKAQQESIQKRYPGTATQGTSTHSYGASVDVLFIETKGNCIKARKVFESVLKEMQEDKHFLVCPESNCIHLTAG